MRTKIISKILIQLLTLIKISILNFIFKLYLNQTETESVVFFLLHTNKSQKLWKYVVRTYNVWRVVGNTDWIALLLTIKAIGRVFTVVSQQVEE